ncbi:hypothetical protein [uncultured Cellulomonas sp.]|uniref:hypothetical protein n=1 Tax=uncultured Cellulomonas sp. TaxID=189682 RepID=UPI002606A92E|nr:hypothetical protein [uncultured Cellulomonas sp.]
MGVRIEDLQLVWPRDLFASELRDITSARPVPGSFNPLGPGPSLVRGVTNEDSVRLLFEEAFYADTGVQWLNTALADGTVDALTAQIAADPLRVPVYARPLLYRDRVAGVTTRERPNLTDTALVEATSKLITELDQAGYFDLAFGEDCVDTENDHAGRGREALSDLMASNEQWPPELDAYGLGEHLDHAYTVIEAAHHFVARPRKRSYHSYGGEWHYDDFDRRAGQGVFRWRMNGLLERSNSLLRLDSSGVLKETTGDPRDELVESLVHDAEAPSPDALSHAIEQFRRRGATRVEKRTAVVALAGILEEHRDLLKEEMLQGDEGALFQIANKFAIRHQRADQQPNYADAYLDWVFWWYLATVDLLRQLLARSSAAHGS